MDYQSDSILFVNADGTLEVKTPAARPVQSSRRGSKRSPSHASIEITAPVFDQGFALNRSDNGMRIMITGRVPVGHEIQLRVEERDGAVSDRTAIVRWVEPHKDGCVVGLEYVRASTKKGTLDSVA